MEPWDPNEPPFEYQGMFNNILWGAIIAAIVGGLIIVGLIYIAVPEAFTKTDKETCQCVSVS